MQDAVVRSSLLASPITAVQPYQSSALRTNRYSSELRVYHGTAQELTTVRLCTLTFFCD